LIAKRFDAFGTTIFSEMTRLAQEHGAINLSQGFPDFDGPAEIVAEAHRAMLAGENQYARSMGHPALVRAIAGAQRERYGLEYDPQSEVAVFCGATEGIAVALLGLVDPGDEVILLEPFYDSYPACVAMAGGVPRYATLRFPGFALEEAELAPLFNPRTRLLVLNSPHNPTGRVFSRAELELVARLCREHDVTVLSDEVYEHLTYGDARHIPIATLPGMRERTLRVSSAGKTFSFTGWKIGWATGPRHLVAAAQAGHQFVTFAVATPLQVAMAAALSRFAGDYTDTLRREYTERRNLLLGVLEEVGFRVARPEGTYFVLAEFGDLFRGTDQEFARHLVREHGVAAIPPSGLYARAVDEGRRLIRFAFCKRLATLESAAARLRGLTRIPSE
jgi:N-succinyldiaminopimelate aminotransferase